MNDKIKSLDEAFQSLCDLVKSKGYLYVLLFMFEDDLFVPTSQTGEVDTRNRLTIKEAAMLLGVYIRENGNITDEPDDVRTLLNLRKETYRLLEDLHWSMNEPLALKMRMAVERMDNGEEPNFPNREELSHAIHQREIFFYSNEPAYDLEYLKFARQKYKYDREWLLSNKEFDCDEMTNLAINIMRSFNSKVRNIQYISKESIEEIICKDRKLKNNKESADKVRDYYALVKYEGQLSTEIKDMDYVDSVNCHDLCKILLDLFSLNSEFCNAQKGFDSLLANFSVDINNGVNEDYTEPGKNNIICSKPIIKIEDQKYLLPIPYLLSQSIYESPYYWMMEDPHYSKIAGSHIGTASEDMVYDLLSPVFGIDKSYKNVIVKKRKETITDIDVLCILGNKALCVQVKSKKLTEKAQIGDDSSYKRDFKGAISDAYKQGLVCRESILKKECEFYVNDNETINLVNIDEVYVLCVTTGFYPALPNQVRLLLELDDEKTTPVVLNLFDLHLVSHYLTDPYDFLYYIRQRISTNDYYIANNETVLLSYHLSNKLWKDSQYNEILLDQSVADNIDADYVNIFSLTTSSIDNIVSPTCKWLSSFYKFFLQEIKSFRNPYVVDVIFDLLDCSNESERFSKMIYDARNRSYSNHTIVSVCMVFEGGKFGITYTASYSQGIDALQNELSVYSNYHKYKTKADKWIGIASCVYRSNLVEVLDYNTNPWVKDENIEMEIKELELINNPLFAIVPEKKKIGRNEPCPCGSGIKYKFCHGKH